MDSQAREIEHPLPSVATSIAKLLIGVRKIYSVSRQLADGLDDAGHAGANSQIQFLVLPVRASFERCLHIYLFEDASQPIEDKEATVSRQRESVWASIGYQPFAHDLPGPRAIAPQ